MHKVVDILAIGEPKMGLIAHKVPLLYSVFIGLPRLTCNPIYGVGCPLVLQDDMIIQLAFRYSREMIHSNSYHRLLRNGHWKEVVGK